MTEGELQAARVAFERILVLPTPADLWQLQKELRVIGGEPAARARVVARSFHACLRTLESKSASRTDSRWGAALGTAAVASVSLGDAAEGREDPLDPPAGGPACPPCWSSGPRSRRSRHGRSRPAWSTTSSRGSCTTSCGTSRFPPARVLGGRAPRVQIALLLDPLLDASVADGDRATLVVHVFQAVLTARLVPLFEERAQPSPAAG